MDVLSDVLASVRLNGAIYFDIDAGSPWVGEAPSGEAIAAQIMPDVEHIIAFHLIMSGSCWAALGDESEPPVLVNAGDIIVFPNGHSNVLSSSRGERGTPNMSIYRRATDTQLPFRLRHGSEGEQRTRFVCGFLGCDSRPFNPLLSSLPPILCARRSDAAGGWVTDLFRVALAEDGQRRAGVETILAKLSELMFVEVVRRHIESLPEDSRGWLAGLRERHVGEALRLIHGQPTRDWTLDGLAHDVGLSRTTFADRFAHFVGMPPMQYLARWRMQLASRRLETPGVSIAQVASEVGYESEAAFNRAFKKLIGVPPGAWRRSRTTVATRH
jgi:AraC-like DNA-binding protein